MNPPVKTQMVTIDGEAVPFATGETLYDVASRRGKDIPTLCYDPRLEAFGACRLCVVEVEGIRNPVASCTTKAAAGMVVKTRTADLEAHRKTLLELVASENPAQAEVSDLRGYASQELNGLYARYAVKTGPDATRFEGKRSGQSRPDDDNPFILRDYDHCISCYRCVRVCAEQEGDFAISVKGRGFDTQITTEFSGLLKDSDCTFCGQCVQTCPTGALGDKKALRFAVLPEASPATNVARQTEKPLRKVRSVCSYCGVGCSVDFIVQQQDAVSPGTDKNGERIIAVQPAMDGPANEGALCVKGQFAYDFISHDDRLKTPYVRQGDKLMPASWDDALDAAAAGFRKVLDERGRRALYAVASGRAPSESAYLTQKFIRATTGTHHVDNCSRG